MSETKAQRCFRGCLPNSTRKACADASGLMINTCGCECHNDFGGEGVPELDSAARAHGDSRLVTSPSIQKTVSETKGKHMPRCPKCGHDILFFEHFRMEEDGPWITQVKCDNQVSKGCGYMVDILRGCELKNSGIAQFFPHEQLVAALRAIAIALKEPAGGEYWTARQFLDLHKVWHGDIDGERVLLEVARAALRAAGEDVE